MGKGPLEVVSPSAWKSRTSKFGRRTGSIVEIDELYRLWHAEHTTRGSGASPVVAGNLASALRKYMIKHGRYWDKVPRNKESGGLMEYIYEQVKANLPPTDVPPVDDTRFIKPINTYDIPHSRYGVLFLLGQIDIDMNKWSIGLEGVSAVGGAVASGIGTDYSKPFSGDAELKVGGSSFMKDMKYGDVAGGASIPFQIGSMATNTSGTKLPTDDRFRTVTGIGPTREGERLVESVHRVHRAPPRPLPMFPATAAIFESIEEDPLLFLNPYTIAGTAVAVTVTAAVEAFNNLRILLINAVTDLFEMIKRKILQNSEWAFEVSAQVVSKAIKFVVGKCLESAAPFVGGAMDMAGGLFQTIKACKERLETYFDRRQIMLVPGHPQELGNAIEHNMTKGIFLGLWTLLKGVASTVLAGVVPGVQSLVSALVTGVEWLIKLIWRIAEQRRISSFLKEARRLYAAERSLAETNTTVMALERPGDFQLAHTGSPRNLEPDMDPSHGGVIHKLPEFTAFFKSGCNASPLIPMITLNTGICGSLMTMIRMFDDAETVIDQTTWDAGQGYFTKLKQHGRDYMRASGFEFLPIDAENKSIRGLLNHALNHHTGHHGKVDKLLAFGANLSG